MLLCCASLSQVKGYKAEHPRGTKMVTLSKTGESSTRGTNRIAGGGRVTGLRTQPLTTAGGLLWRT